MARIRVVTTRAPGLIPSLIKEIRQAPHPVVLIPESFTLACETEIVNQSPDGGIFDLKIFSPSSLIREVRELTGRGNRKPISGDGQNMIISQVLHHCRDELKYYRESVAQPTLAAKIAGQIDDFTRARLTPGFLRQYTPASRRTAAKLEDVALIWDGYRQILDKGFEDTVGQWMSAVRLIRQSGIVRDSRLLIYGFDYITHDLLNLVNEVSAPGDGGADEIVIGLISDDVGPDRDIFRAANDSVEALRYFLDRKKAAYTVQREDLSPRMDAGIAYAEKNLYALGAFGSEKIYTYGTETYIIREDPGTARKTALAELTETFVPDMSHVRMYYAKNSYLECQHACQTLIDWHRAGIPWEDMAIAVCEQNTLPSLLPLTLSASGIPFNAKQDQPILMSGYAQYFLSLLRILRLNFCREDVLRLIKTGFTDMTPEEIMDMENYARENGIHRSRWLKPFHIPEKDGEREKAERLEELRQKVTAPIAELKKKLSRKACTGKEAAALLFEYVTDAGIYERLQEQEEVLAAQEDDLGIDRNRQVWTAVNELLDTVATFIGDEPLPLHDLCAMLEASLASRKIKSLPQLSGAVMVAPPQMFFSSGVRCMIVMGLQENEIFPGASILSEHERGQLEAFIEEDNRRYYSEQYADDPYEPGMWENGAAGEGMPAAGSLNTERPYSKIGQSLTDLAARQKQDVYQAVSLAREELMISCSGARPSGGVMTPSAAFTRLQKTIGKTNPKNVNGGLMDTDIRPFAPAFALEALAVRLRETRDSRDGFLQGGTEEDALWRNALGSLYQSDEWKKKVEGILKGLHVTMPSAEIAPEQARKLYITHGMTISRAETFASCPYRHFLQYGLGLAPTGTYTFQRNEQGTFNHDVVQIFLEKAMQLPEWPDMSEETQTKLLNRILKDRVKRWEGGILTSDTMHRYQGAGIIRGVRTAIASMMRAFRQKPHFLPLAAEVPFGMPDADGKIRIPAIRLKTSDGDTVAFSGRIDRIDVLETPEGRKYFNILDNKMSGKELRQNSIAAGLQLQIPLYIRAARTGLPGYEAGGGLFQPIRDVLADSEDAEQIRTQIDRDLQTTGMILDEEQVLEAARPVKIARKTGTSDTVSTVSTEEMRAIEDCAVRTATDLVTRILRGEASARPVRDGAEATCAYCDHLNACRYDSTIPGCRIVEIDHKHRIEI